MRGRFDGFVRLGDEILILPDMDEALFPIPGVLNFTVSMTGETETPSLSIEIDMLTREDCSAQIEQALRDIPSIKDIQMKIQCQYHPEEPGSLRKRVVVDERR